MSTALLPVYRVAVLVAHDQNSAARAKCAIDYGVWEAGEGKATALVTSGVPISGCSPSSSAMRSNSSRNRAATARPPSRR